MTQKLNTILDELMEKIADIAASRFIREKLFGGRAGIPIRGRTQTFNPRIRKWT
jgi:hypothetical protein